MEQTKYLEPNISFSFEELAALLRSNTSCTDSTMLSNYSNIDKLTVKSFNIKSLPTTPSNSKAKSNQISKPIFHQRNNRSLNKDIKITPILKTHNKVEVVSQHARKKLPNFKSNISENLLDPIKLK